jgi:hypothetical protein
MDEREDRGRRADAKRKCKDGSCREARSVDELPNRVTDIVQELHGASDWLIRIASTLCSE